MSEPLELQLKLTVAPKGKKYEVCLYCRELGIDAGPYPLRLPLDDKVLEELRWYLEQYPRWPVGPDVERAERIKAQLAGWGRALFDAAFASTEAIRVWTQFRAHEPGRPRLLTLDCTEPDVLRLPWELLADEETHLSMLDIGFRRRLHKAQAAPTRAFDLPVRVLMVVARPEDESVAFIDPRASSQALLAALEPLGDAAVVEFLPVGTLAALDKRLTDRRAPPVHVVHFDGHGVYDRRKGLGYLIFEDAQGRADLVDAEKLGALLARSGIPLMVLDACQSAHADADNPFTSVAPRLIQAGIGSVAAMQYSVLVPTSKRFFAAFYTALTEGETIGQAMDAGRRALLRDEFRFMLHHPDGSDRPIALRDWFLPALYQQAADPAPFKIEKSANQQIGEKAGEREGEKARERKGDPLAVYEAGLTRLAAQLEGDPLEADARTLEVRLRENLRFARVDGDTETRRAERNAILRALDTLCDRALGLPFEHLCESAGERKGESANQQGGALRTTDYGLRTTDYAPLLGDFPRARYGFIGRARELWRLERLFAQRRIVVLHAFGGQGKTALASEAADWLTRTGRFARAVFLSFEQGGAADWALTQLGRLLLGNDFSSLAEADRLPALQRALAAAPTLLIWDNFESVLPGAHAALPPQDLDALLSLGAALVSPTNDYPTKDSPTTRLLITTRDPDLPHDAFRPGATTALLPLDGLTKWEALDLAGAVLDAQNAPRPPRLELERLLDFLGGHPLSIQLVAPHLREYPDVQTVIDRFETLYPGFTRGEAKARDESLDVSLRFSLDRLSETARARVAALGVFEGGALEFVILMVTGLKPSEWLPARAELVRAGLATVEMESPFGIQTAEGQFGGYFLRFHPTLTPALRRRLDAAALPALETAYWQAYHQLARYLYSNDKKDPKTIRAVAQRELPNLRRGVALALAAADGGTGDFAAAVEFAECVERFLNTFGRWRERAAMMEAVGKGVGSRGVGSTGPLTRAEWMLLSRQGEMLWEQGRAREAETVFRGLLARMMTGDGRPATGDGGLTTNDSGLTTTYDLTLTLGRLGRSLRDQGRPREAEAEYRRKQAVLEQLLGGRALPTTGLTTKDSVDANQWRQMGVTHADLADVLMLQGRYAEARAQYEAALKIVEALGDERSVATVSAQLGTLALQEGDFAEAERQYRAALARSHALGETRMEAIGWHQLGRVYQEAGGREQGVGSRGVGSSRAALLQQAEEAYRQSLQLDEALGDQAGAAKTANQLAQVAQMAGRPANAARWYRRALRDFQAAGQMQYVAVTCNNLADLLLAAARGKYGPPPPAGVAESSDLLAEAESLARQAARLMEQIGDPSLGLWATYNILAGIAEARGDPAAARDWRRKERAAFVAFPGHWANLSRQYGGVVQAIVDALQGDPSALAALEKMYPQMLAGGSDWHTTPEAIRRLLAGARDLDALADELDILGAQYLLLSKALEMAAGGAVHESGAADCATNARMGGAAPEVAPDQEAQARALMAALQAWVETPAGQSALRELQAQGLGEEALVMGLLQRFAASQGGPSSPRGGKSNK